MCSMNKQLKNKICRDLVTNTESGYLLRIAGTSMYWLIKCCPKCSQCYKIKCNDDDIALSSWWYKTSLSKHECVKVETSASTSPNI